jgi:hypothetical protein
LSEPPYVGTTYTTDLGYVSITTMEGWDKGTPNSNYALTIVPTDSKFGWVDIKDLQLSSLEDDIEYISVGYPGTTWTEMTIGSNTFQYMKTLTGTVCYCLISVSLDFHKEPLSITGQGDTKSAIISMQIDSAK